MKQIATAGAALALEAGRKADAAAIRRDPDATDMLGSMDLGLDGKLEHEQFADSAHDRVAPLVGPVIERDDAAGIDQAGLGAVQIHFPERGQRSSAAAGSCHAVS